MSFYIAAGAVLLWFVLAGLAKQLHHEAKERWEERVMADYLRAEEARAHRQGLAEIEAIRRTAVEAMLRTARESDGGVIDTTAEEIEPR